MKVNVGIKGCAQTKSQRSCEWGRKSMQELRVSEVRTKIEGPRSAHGLLPTIPRPFDFCMNSYL